MILILEVASPQGAKAGVRRQEFGEKGGIIGRGNESFWVLPHSKVSGRHAVISCRNGVFYIEDTSRNGVCINSPDNRLVHGRPYALKSGDQIFIEPYEIHASIVAEPNEAARWSDSSDVRSSGRCLGGSNPFGGDDPFAQREVSLIDSSVVTPPSEAMGQELDPLKLLDPSPKLAPVRKAPAPGAKDLARGSVMDEHYRPPAVLPASTPPQRESALIPPGYDPLAPEDSVVMAPVWPPPPVERISTRSPHAAPEELRPNAPEPALSVAATPAPAPPPPTDAANGAVGALDLGAMLAGAGLAGAALTPQLARDFGRILRVVVSGVMDVLQARQQIKEEFRMDMTRFRPAANNPLKFSANVDDALHNLLVKRNAAYLAPVEAFADAFDDLRNHQIAMLAGMRVAFESMLAEFDPDRLQEQFDRQPSRGALLRVPAQLRYWDLYRDKCRDMVKDRETSFRNLFGEEFARAYEEQLERLKAEGQPGPKKGPR